MTIMHIQTILPLAVDLTIQLMDLRQHQLVAKKIQLLVLGRLYLVGTTIQHQLVRHGPEAVMQLLLIRVLLSGVIMTLHVRQA